MSGISDRRGQAPAAGALLLEGVACARGERTLFSGLDVCIHAGCIAWLRGANGQGKTTLLRTIAGLSSPAAGRITRTGAVAGWPMLFLGHANALKDDLTAVESLCFLLRLDGREPAPGEAEAALARFGLASRRDAPVRTLSQGQRRRVALGRLAVRTAPALWLLDEPYDALDAAGVATLDAVLSAHAKAGGIVVLTSHLPLGITEPAPQIVELDAAVAA